MSVTGGLPSCARSAYNQRVNNELRRANVALIPRTQEALDATTRRTGLSKTDVVNRAVQAYAFLEEQWSAGARILVQHGDMTEEVRFL
jgi:hypothetical protein